MQGYTDNGIIGRPSLGTADKGKAAVEHLTQSFATHLRLLDKS
jgi:creatinine amidohydrolase